MWVLRYCFSEAATRLWRARGPSVLAVVTIGLSLFVLGLFLLLNANLQRLVSRWGESAELSIYLQDEVTAEELKTIDDVAAQSGLADRRAYVSKDEALKRFRADFPDLGGVADVRVNNPLPASFELRLRSDLRDAYGPIESLVTTVSNLAGVADVRYDRQWLGRLNAVIRGGQVAGGVIVALLALAAAMTVGNVVRLGVAARRDEIEIMQLVGAPVAYVRGPFVAEGALQGGAGALLALLLLGAACHAVRLRYGAAVVQALGGAGLTFLSIPQLGLLLLGGMALGSVGAYAIARQVR